MTHALDIGDPCPAKCGGTLTMPQVQNCSCHISPPCGACLDTVLTCNTCDWEDEKP